MIQIPVTTGASTIIVSGSDFEEAAQLAQVVYKEISCHLPNDAVIRARRPKDDWQYEYYSPILKAARKLSKSKAVNAAHPKFAHYIGYATPWVRITYAENDVRQFHCMFDNLDDQAIASGFEQPLRWYLATPIPKSGFSLMGDPAGAGDVFYRNYLNILKGYVAVARPSQGEIRARHVARKRTGK